ncbi:MAG: putative toxin-antitoxin system toxin component, PIN family [Bacillota bacterium]|nr:putative toxin-antitoxin system toxin component, PIN family [Bacillota bacterium]
MKIVVDTNVVISGVFFGGAPAEVLKAIVASDVTACATAEIIEEYLEIVDEMITRKQGSINKNMLMPLINSLEIIEPRSSIKISRDPDDDKFIECAKDSKALYIVSGDKDLLVLKEYEDIQIITAKEFCNEFLIK